MRFKSILLSLLVIFIAGGASAKSVLRTPAADGKSSEPEGITDHELIVKQVGVRVVHWGKVGPATTAITGRAEGDMGDVGAADQFASMRLTTIGVRTWFNKRLGLDAGMSLYLHRGKDERVQFGMGVAAGVPIALGYFKHITIYAEPRFDLSFMRVAKGTIPVLFGAGADLGAELSFGWIGIPRLTLQLAVGLAMRLQNDGDRTDFVLATRDFIDSLAYNLGVTYYF